MKKISKKSSKLNLRTATLCIGTFLLLSTFSFYSCSSDPIPEETAVENSEIEENDLTNLNSRVSDNDFNIFSVTSQDVKRSDFPSIKKWYSEGVNTQVFKLFKYDQFSGSRSDHARTEAGQGLKWKKTATTHTFEATYNVTSNSKENLTIAQIFAGCCGPQLMIHIRSNGNIDYGSRGNGNAVIDRGNWKGKDFKIKLTMKNDVMKFYFNGVKKFEGKADERSNTKALYHFRWGVYSNNSVRNDGKMDQDAQVIVKRLTRN